MQSALQYGTTIGYPPLRETLVERLLAADGQTAASPERLRDRVVLTAGSNELLYLVSDILFDPGDIVLCSSPSYFVYLGTLGNLGVRAVGIASDAQGIIPAAVEEEILRRGQAGELERVKAVYVTTYFDNPCGVSLPAARRAALVEVVRRCASHQKIYLIEDAAYRELRYFDDDIRSLWSFDEGGETVIHAGTFSKSFSPGIRIGWGVLPRELVEPLLAEKGHIDFGSPNFNQHLMHEIVRSGDYDEHVAMLRGHYRAEVAGDARRRRRTSRLDSRRALRAAQRRTVSLGGIARRDGCRARRAAVRPGGGRGRFLYPRRALLSDRRRAAAHERPAVELRRARVRDDCPRCRGIGTGDTKDKEVDNFRLQISDFRFAGRTWA